MTDDGNGGIKIVYLAGGQFDNNTSVDGDSDGNNNINSSCTTEKIENSIEAEIEAEDSNSINLDATDSSATESSFSRRKKIKS